MAKKTKKAKTANDINLFYLNGQAKQTSDVHMEKRNMKEREKRIKENKAKREMDFDEETEEVIKMTNKNKIKKDAKERKKLEQQEIKKRARNRKIKLVLKIILLIAIIAGGITFAMVSPLFNIKEIQVLNNNQLSSEEIVSLSELKQDENIFRFISFEAINKIKTNPYIESVKIHRKLPNTIQIEVVERNHTFSVDFLGQYAYINNQGYILEISEDSKQKTIIRGIETKEENMVVGNRLCDEDLEKLEDVIKVMYIAKEYDLDTKITSIDINDKNNYNMYIEAEQKTIYLGNNSNLSNKMLYVNAIINETRGEKGEIFANGDLNNKFRVYFKKNLDV